MFLSLPLLVCSRLSHHLSGLSSLLLVMQGGCAPFMGELLRTSLAEGIGDRILNKLNAAYKERSRRLYEILQTEPGIQIDSIPLGGYFLWISFSGVDDTTTFVEYCESQGVKFLPGKRCDPLDEENSNAAAFSGLPPNECQKWARLCFADLDVEDLEDGAKLLISCYREYVADTKKGS
jgi:DNA-binding transcriptional MocR family regulator